MTFRAQWMLRTAFVFLASSWLGAAAAGDEGSSDLTGGAHAPENSSQRIAPADFWLNLHALDLNVYGLSYHPDREAVHRKNLDNQFNPGLGLHYQLVEYERGTTFAEVGAFEDSGRNWAKFADLGYQFKLSSQWKMGGALAVMNSRTYNGGATFVAMIPLITYDFGPIKLNATYLPRIPRHSEVAAFAFYFSIPIVR
jgi:hypothetical protein